MHSGVLLTSLLALAAAPAAVEEGEPRDPEEETDDDEGSGRPTPAGARGGAAGSGPPDEDPRWVELHWRPPHLDVDLTPTLHWFFPPEDEAGVELGEGAALDYGREGSPRVTVAAPEALPDDGGGSLSFFILPDVRYNPDEGLGLGVAIPVVWSEPGVAPYKYSFVLQLVTSSKLVQDQALLFDVVDLFGWPVRIAGQAGFYAFADEPFCGVGSTATCDPRLAEAAAANQSPDDEASSERAARYYLMRLVRPYAWGTVRYELFDALGKWEVFAGLRSEWYVPGFFGDVLRGELFEPGPYEGSLFAERDAAGEPGFVNVPQVGLMVDSRDFEPSPRAGYWLEASLRGAHPWALSSWAFAGANVTGRLYVPLVPSKTLTLANRVVADVIVGDAPVQELARFGGSQDYRGFGGRWVGRGMRQQRFIGNVKLAYQPELRWDAVRFDVSGFSLGFELVAFLDAGLVLAEGVDYDRAGLRRPLRPLVAGGVGLRWVINKNIVIRADLGTSPDEGFAPQLYFDGRHIF